MFFSQKLTDDQKQHWKTAARKAMQMAEFRELQKQHSHLVPELKTSMPHQTFFTRNFDAAKFMDTVFTTVLP
jgi:tripartite-type tricarboxylate transporter receptor subunit TctC